MRKCRIALLDDKLENKKCYIKDFIKSNITTNKKEAFIFNETEALKYKKMAKKICHEKTPVIEYECE